MDTKRFIIAVLLITSGTLYAQSNRDKCGIVVADVTSTALFGYLNTYAVTFKNTNDQTVDGIYFRAVFYNNEGRKMEEIQESFNSTSLIDPVSPGVTKILMRSPAVKGASKVVILVDRAHFVNGESCK